MTSMLRRPWHILKSAKNPAVARVAVGLRKLSYGEITYVKTNELVSDTLEWIKSFPQRFDMVVGIPRAGLIPASIISTQLGVPLTMPDLFPRAFISNKTYDTLPNEVLVVDDASGRAEGGTMDTILKMLTTKSPKTKFWKASTYVMESCANFFDLYHRVIRDKGRFVCEWNLQHDKYFGILGADMDGVLCEDCSEEDDKDEAKYVNHLVNARPYFIPDYEIDYIVTGRLEKYRAETEAWLARHRIKYGKLIMWNLQDKSQRTNPAQYKAKELLLSKPGMFIESRHLEAGVISRKVGIHVFCFEHMNFVGKC